MGDFSHREACPRCGATNAEVHAKARGRSEFRCRRCKCHFRAGGFLIDRHYTAVQVGDALEKIFRGGSFEAAAERVRNASGTNGNRPSRQTVTRWYREYVDETVRVAARYRIALGRHYTVSRSSMHRVQGTCWAVTDNASLFVLATLFSDAERSLAGEVLIRKAVATVKGHESGSDPRRLGSADDAAGAVYSTLRNRQRKPTVFSTATDDQMIWTMLGADRDSDLGDQVWARLRSLTNLADGQRFLDGRAFMHNTFRRSGHMEGPTAAQKVGIDLAFGSWAEVLQWLQRVNR